MGTNTSSKGRHRTASTGGEVVDDVILGIEEVCRRTQLSKVSIWRLSRSSESDFPRPVRLTPSGSRVGWRQSQISEWIRTREPV